MGEVIGSDHGDTGVGFANQGALYLATELADKIRCHHIRGYAVKANGSSTRVFQIFQHRPGIHTGKEAAIRLHGKGIDAAA
jgi:hypothetical protein